MQYLITFSSWPGKDSDVVFSRFVGPIVPEKPVKFRDSLLNVSRKILPEAVGCGIFNGFLNITSDRKKLLTSYPVSLHILLNSLTNNDLDSTGYLFRQLLSILHDAEIYLCSALEIDQCKYLGSTQTKDGTSIKEVWIRLAQSWRDQHYNGTSSSPIGWARQNAAPL